MSSSPILQSENNGIVTLEFNRPEKMNALNVAMYVELKEALERAAKQNAIAAVLLQGSGGNFSSGNDLADFASQDTEKFGKAVLSFLDTLAQFPKPIVAKVQGYAVGIGTTMLLHCDFAYATKDAQFGLPFVKLGLVPEAASSYLLPLLAGHRKASELLLLAQGFGSDEAKEMGILNAVGNEQAMDSAVEQTLALLRSLPREAVLESKRLLKLPFQKQIQDQIKHEAQAFMLGLRSAATQQAIAAFFEKSKTNA
ncbi:MAG: enoyl-CoA hydratase/isomerase family protein [Myxococcales bacterium]|nr:MAG: enoyl-CoA hydratase/isomerase family protein [Myxococcales bacterium]